MGAQTGRVRKRKGGRAANLGRQLEEACETVKIVAAFVAFSALFGVANQLQSAADAAASAGRLDEPKSPAAEARFRGAASRGARIRPTTLRMRDAADSSELWLVDGFNVLNVAILRGSERDDFWGPSAREQLLRLIQQRADQARIVVVFDGPEPVDGSAAGPALARVVFAKNADEWLLRRLRESGEPEKVSVVTADRRLAARARQRGAQVVTPGRFVAECREATPDGVGGETS